MGEEKKKEKKNLKGGESFEKEKKGMVKRAKEIRIRINKEKEEKTSVYIRVVQILKR